MTINKRRGKLSLVLGFTVLLVVPYFCGRAQEVQPDSISRGADTVRSNLSEKKLEEELARELYGSDTTGNTESIPVQPQGSPASLGSILNPRISAIGAFIGSVTEKDAASSVYDAGLSEAELAFQAYVDPYSKADFFIAFHRERQDPFFGPEFEDGAESGYHPELEEAYLTLLTLPFGLQVKAGQFRLAFGRINTFHLHALNYVDYPRMYVNFLGGEGLADRGIGVSWLIPNPLDFYQELSLGVTSGQVESSSFGGGTNSVLLSAHLKNFFDLSDNSTLEVGLSTLHGSNDPQNHKTLIGAADITYKWKPLGKNLYRSFEWTAEVLVSSRNSPMKSVTSSGWYSFLRYQLSRRWFVAARYDYSEFPYDDARNEKAYSLIANFFATEFQKLEVQVQHGVPSGWKEFNRVLLRVVFVIGAHGAHNY
ncbi:MAG: hypothetical protein GXO82_07805 [Chlorobi bacterium]|nr:hypothetical protein [Chlorobiota bacterium]